MRVRILLIIAVLAAVGGCSVGFEVWIPVDAGTGPAPVPTSTKVSGTRLTPTPDPLAPHYTIRMRLFVADQFHSSVLIPARVDVDGIRDAQAARAVWQSPTLATDKAAQQRAVDTMDCFHDNPLLGQDDPTLPLATCTPDASIAVLAPTLLTADMVAGATYGVSDDPAQGGTVWVQLNSSGRRVMAEMAPKNVDVLLALLFDGKYFSSLTVTAKLTDTLAFRFDDTNEARVVASMIVNR
ncbi:hypothetical protein [Kutzneria sp. NPDC051319]|uniref:hypothetical protein n=1 Tax=Kutzneria sp. NPDC051319 TaxID=3155047 RepID=UPI0034184C9A